MSRGVIEDGDPEEWEACSCLGLVGLVILVVVAAIVVGGLLINGGV